MSDNNRASPAAPDRATQAPPEAPAGLRHTVSVPDAARFYIDCEFDGHGGPLLSIALVTESGEGIHVRATDATATDPWVIENVVPLLRADHGGWDIGTFTDNIGAVLRNYITCRNPVIVADSPVDIGRFCTAISTGPDGGWAPTDYTAMTFEVHNVDCYPTDLPGAVQHNAWWDAMALRHLLASAAGARSDETAKLAQSEGRQSGPKGDAHE